MRIKRLFCYITIIVPTTGMLLMSSCAKSTEDKVKKMMGKYYKMQLRIPPNWTLVNGANVKPEDMIDPRKPTSNYYVLHYFSSDCDKCLKQLVVDKKFIHENRKKFPNLAFVFVAGGIYDYYIKDAIRKSKFDFPVFFDNKYLTFNISNGIPINNEPLYGTMLIDKHNRLVLFGSIFDNEKATYLYSNIVNSPK